MEDIIKNYNHIDSRSLYPEIEKVQKEFPFAHFYIKAKIWDYEDEPVEEDFEEYEDYEDAHDDFEPDIHIVNGRVRVIAHNWAKSLLIQDNPLQEEWAWLNTEHVQAGRGRVPLYEFLDESLYEPGKNIYQLHDHIFIMDEILELRIHFPQVSNSEAKVTLERWQD